MPDSRPTVEADDSPSIDLQILDAQVRALQRNVPSMVVGTLLTAVATVHYFSPVMPEGLDLRRWFAAMLAVSVVRIAAMWLWRRDPAVGRRPAYWARWMVALAVLTGLIWGSLATIYMPTEQSGYRPVMASLLMGVSAAVVVSQVTLYRAFALFLVAMLLPAMLSFAFLPGDVARMLTIMLAFFLLLLLVGGRQSSEASKRSLRLQMELRQLARAEEHARLSAERANAAKSQFLMNMSHELRTPMHAVMAYAQLGVTRCNEPKIRGYLERIHTSASGLLALLGDLLDLARLETGRMEFRIRPKDPLLLVERIAAEFGPQLRHRDVRLEVVAAGELPLVPLDESRVAQVLRNLVANAFRHSPDNGLISIAVGVVAGEQGRELVLRVRDQGVGIPEDELESVFEKFVQSSKTRSGAGGVGLGLAICREIVSAHGGRIRALGNDDGALLEVVLPAPETTQVEDRPAVAA
ncbi:MAG: HAMP domain-containing histidine kinase [Rhodocyclaceae bacterium]|nr:HAMP domain-containing histidine kinase [Rhodocyclaceae bacterium]